MTLSRKPTSFAPRSAPAQHDSKTGNHGKEAGSSRALIAIALRLGGAGLGMLMHITFARLMSLEGYGVLILALTMATLVSVFASLGMPFCAIRFLPGYVHRARASHSALFERMSLVMTGLGSTVALLLGLSIIGGFHSVLPPDIVRGIKAAIPLVFVLGFAQTMHALLVARDRILLADTIQSVVRPALCIFAAFAVSRSGPLSFDAALFITVGTGVLVLLGLGLAYPFTKAPLSLRTRHKRQAVLVKNWIRVGLIIVLTASAVAMLERIDILIIGILLGTEEVAVYSAASRLAMIGAIVISASNAVFGPGLSKAVSEGDAGTAGRLARKAAFLPTLALIFFFLGALLGGDRILVLFGPSYATGWPVLCVLAGAQLALASFGATGGIVVFAKGESVVVKAVLSGLLVDLGLNLALIPWLGSIGAAVGSLIALCFIFGWLGLWCRANLTFPTDIYPAGRLG